MFNLPACALHAVREVGHIINLTFKDKEKVGFIDMEAIKMGIRSSMHGIGRVLLEEMINADCAL